MFPDAQGPVAAGVLSVVPDQTGAPVVDVTGVEAAFSGVYEHLNRLTVEIQHMKDTVTGPKLSAIVASAKSSLSATRQAFRTATGSQGGRGRSRGSRGGRGGRGGRGRGAGPPTGGAEEDF